MIVRRMDMSEVAAWVHSPQHLNLESITVMGGDRLTACDEGFGVEVEGEIVSVATIAPQGEMASGEPTIVGLYTSTQHRRQGYARAAFIGAVARCRERGFSRVRVDVMSKAVRRIIETLPQEDQAYLDIHDLGDLMDLSGFFRIG